MTNYQPIRTDTSNTFAHHTMKVRFPQLIRTLQARHRQYAVLAALDALHDALAHDAPLEMLRLPAPDADLWRMEFALRRGESWQNTLWWFAEAYFFRQIIQAVRYFETGVDPYLEIKQDEFYSPALKQLLPQVLEVGLNPTDENLHQLLLFSLWGNRADLSLRIEHSVSDGNTETLLADQRVAAVEQLRRGTGTVHIVTDNAGTEQALDMVLVDTLLRLDIPVMLHVKMHPTYVSDTTTQDVWYFISDLVDGEYNLNGNTLPMALGERLAAALDTGQLRLAPDFYWNSPRWLDDLPLRIQETFQGARLVILKGDANYRRSIHDTIYPADLPHTEVLQYFPEPLLTLRTLKSDAVVGLPTATVQRLDATETDWRITGKYGVIQYTPKG